MSEDKWYLRYKFAHRGLHDKSSPENSMGAFAKAMEKDFAIELDIHKTKDNHIVVFHDDNLQRMCGIDDRIEDLPLAKIQTLSLLGSKEKIPTLNEVLELIDGKVPLLIELKPSDNREEFCKCVFDELKDYTGRYALQSFDPRLLVYFRDKLPGIPRGMLSSCFKTTYAPFPQRVFVKHLFMYKKVNPAFISFDASDLPNKLVTSKKVPVLAWTVRSKTREKDVMQHANSVIFEGYTPDSPFNY